MAVNKVVKSDGTTLIDLSQDTVTSASHILRGHTGHLADGSQVTGAADKAVTYSLTGGAYANVTPEKVITDEGLSLKLSVPAGYNLSNVSVIMGGVDVTSQVFEYDEDSGGGGGGTYRRTEILPEQTVTPGSGRTATLTGMSMLEDGAAYIVAFDGDEWAWTCETMWGSAYTLGDVNLYFGNSGDFVAPFGLGMDFQGNADIAVMDTSQHTVKIEKLEFVEDGEVLTTKTITTNGTYSASDDDADGYSSVTVNVPSGSSKAIYTYKGLASRTANSYGATNATVTVTKAGTYTISYVAIRGSSSGTMGTNLYIGSTSGTNNTTWNNGTYGQYVTLTNQTIAANTAVTIYATSGNNSRTIYVGQLIVEEE